MDITKNKMLNTLNEKAKIIKEINFREVANGIGIKHMDRQAVTVVMNRFLKANPTYKAYHNVSNPNNSLFCGLILSELEYEN